MNTDMMKTEVMFISTGLFISLVTGAPTTERTVCPSDWTYGQFISGSGCLRPINNEFTEENCLTAGYHISLLTNNDKNSYRPEDIMCVKDERYEKKVTNDVTTQKPTLKTKLKTEHIENSKEHLAKPFGCCMQGLSPSG